MHSSCPDRDLVARASRGDSEAQALLYRRYQPVARRYGLRLTGCPTTADDLAQEAFLTLFHRLSRYDPERAALSTYLYGIVRYLSLERLRQARRFRSMDDVAADASAEADPLEALAREERGARVWAALSALPRHQREVVVLCDVRGHSYAEAADTVGVSVAAVRARLHQGRQRLRQRLLAASSRS